MPSQRAAKLVAQLESVTDIQARIDIVANDFDSTKNKYAAIDAWTLGELLGIEFETVGDEGRTYWGYRAKLEDCGEQFPFAENVELLENLVSKKRYAELQRQAATLKHEERAGDPRLTNPEQSLLEQAYAEANPSSEGAQTAGATLRSSSGVELDFEVVFDSDGPIEAFSPYELEKGKGLRYHRLHRTELVTSAELTSRG